MNVPVEEKSAFALSYGSGMRVVRGFEVVEADEELSPTMGRCFGERGKKNEDGR